MGERTTAAGAGTGWGGAGQDGAVVTYDLVSQFRVCVGSCASRPLRTIGRTQLILHVPIRLASLFSSFDSSPIPSLSLNNTNTTLLLLIYLTHYCLLRIIK